MQVQVVSDAQGRIISLSRLGDVGEQVSGIARAGVFPENDQQVLERGVVLLGEEVHPGFFARRVDAEAAAGKGKVGSDDEPQCWSP